MKDKLTTASLIAPVLVLMLVLCLGSFVADAQQSTVPRVGWLAGGSPPAFQHITEAFLQGMREHGYINGQNFVLEIRAAEGRFDRLPGLAADLVRSKVAVIVVASTSPLRTERTPRMPSRSLSRASATRSPRRTAQASNFPPYTRL